LGENASVEYDLSVSASVAQRWARRVERWQRRLQPRLPDISPEDLALILASILRPKQVPRRFLLRPVGDRGLVL
jgi:hypothetical protein